MENRSHALMTGLFTLFLGASVVLALWWFGDQDDSTDDYLVATTSSLSGLTVQAQVRYRGMRVGRVTAIEFDPADSATILIHIRVRKGLPMTSGTVASLGSLGVTGIAYLFLEETVKEAAPLVAREDTPPPRIPMRKTFALQDMAISGQEALTQMKDALSALNELLRDKKIAATLANIEAVSGDAREISARLKSFATRENLQRLDAILVRSEQTVGQAAPFFAEARELVARLQRVGEKLDLAMGDPSKTPGASSSLKLDEIAADFSTSLRELNRILQRLEESPQSLIFGYKKSPGPGETGFSTLEETAQ